MHILNASYFIYIYPHIFLHIGFYWILMQTLYAFYIHVFTPIGWFSYLEEGSQIPETRYFKTYLQFYLENIYLSHYLQML